MVTVDVLPAIEQSPKTTVLQQRMQHSGLWFIAIAFAISRALLVVATLLASFFPRGPSHPNPLLTPWWQTWQQWDTSYYLDIANHGYAVGTAQSFPAFFPLYPLAIHIFSLFTGGNAYLAALLVANGAWFIALLGVYALAQRDFDQRTARATVVMLLVFPTAFFSFVPYSESLFIALAIAAFTQMRLGQWHWAALLGMLAALTRQTGVLLLLPFLWEYALQHHWTWQGIRLALADLPHASQVFALCKRLRPTLLWGLLIPGGMVVYALWLWHAVGDPLAFLHVEANWARISAFPPWTLWKGAHGLLSQVNTFLTFRIWEEFILILGMFLVLGITFRRAPASYSVLAIAFMLTFLSHPTDGWIFDSQSRYLLEVFPAFIMLGNLITRYRWGIYALASVFLPLQLLLIGMFARGAWVI